MKAITRKETPILVGSGRVFVLAIGLSLGLTQTACVSMSSLQTARTLEKGKAQWAVSGGAYTSGAITDAVTDKKADTLSLPFMEVAYRQGLAKDWDFGVKATLSGSVYADAKYGIVQGQKFALATGLGLGYFNMEVKAGEEKSSTSVYDVTVPLLASYDLAKSFSLYAGPKYVGRIIKSSAGNGQANLGGGTAGIKIGDTWGAYIEASYFKNLGKDPFDGNQFNVALFWNANPLF